MSTWDGSNSLTVSNSTIRNNNGDGIWINNLVDGSVQYNNIYDNAGYGIYNAKQPSLDARYNWWGSASGPAPYGSGNGINYLTYECGTPPQPCYDYEYYVHADPWLESAALPVNGSLDGTFTLIYQRPDGVNLVAFFNQRADSSGLGHDVIKSILDLAVTA